MQRSVQIGREPVCLLRFPSCAVTLASGVGDRELGAESQLGGEPPAPTDAPPGVLWGEAGLPVAVCGARLWCGDHILSPTLPVWNSGGDQEMMVDLVLQATAPHLAISVGLRCQKHRFLFLL